MLTGMARGPSVRYRRRSDQPGWRNGRVMVNKTNAAAIGKMMAAAGETVHIGDIFCTGLGTMGTTHISATINVGSHLWVGWNSKITGTIKVDNDCILNVSGQLGLNWQNNRTRAFVTIHDGGIVNPAQIHSSGNFVSVINNKYIDTGKIFAAGFASIDLLHHLNTNPTFLAIPETAPPRCADWRALRRCRLVGSIHSLIPTSHSTVLTSKWTDGFLYSN